MTLRLPILSLLAALLLLPLAAHAYDIQTGTGSNTIAIASGDVLSEETLLAGYRVDVQGDARRDLWLAASTDVQFGGHAEEDLRILARSAVLRGAMDQNLLAYASGLQLATSSVVRGQAALFGHNVICEGRVEGDAWIYARSATLGGTWGGNVRILGDEIRVAPGTHVKGSLIYTAPKAPVLDSSVVIEGGMTNRPALLPEAEALSPAATRARFALHGYLFLAALLIGMPFVGLFPLVAGSAVRNLRTSPWRVLFAGTAAILLGPFLMGFAVMTVVGIPLAIVLGALYLLLIVLSHIVVALWIGHRLLRQPGPQTFGQVLAALATGLFLFYFATALPGVASFVVLPVVVLGTGALVTSRLPLQRFLPPRPPAIPLKKTEPPNPPEA